MPPLQSYKRRRVACQHFPDGQTLRLQTGAGEDNIIHLLSGLDCVDCERQEEEVIDAIPSKMQGAMRVHVAVEVFPLSHTSQCYRFVVVVCFFFLNHISRVLTFEYRMNELK